MSNDDLITLGVFTALELVCVVIILVAGLKIVVAFVRARRLRRTQGVVVAHQMHQTTMRSSSGYGSRQVTLIKPVVRFTAPDGRLIDLLHPVASSAPPPVGAAVPVDFDPQNPNRAEVASGLARYFAAGVTLAAVGLLLTILVGVELSILF